MIRKERGSAVPCQGKSGGCDPLSPQKHVGKRCDKDGEAGDAKGTPEDLALEDPDDGGRGGGDGGGAGAGVHEGDLPEAVAARLAVDAHVDALPPLQHLKLPALHHVQLAGPQPWKSHLCFNQLDRAIISLNAPLQGQAGSMPAKSLAILQ